MVEHLACERAWINIDLAALAHNVQQIKSLLHPHTAMMAVVKADAYGHGATTVAQTAVKHGASWLAVATVLEGITLRRAGITTPILILGAIHSPQEVTVISEWQLQPTISSPKQALAISQYLDHSIPVHLKIDTGMSRLGPLWPKGAAFVEFVAGLSYLEINSIYSHLATADEHDQSFMVLQQNRFEACIQRLRIDGNQPLLHLANSAGTLQGPKYHYDLVRTGLVMYGLYPGPQFQEIIALKPVMQVKARITQIKTLPAETGISYNHRHTTTQPTTIAVVGIGYADGIPRPLSNQLQVLVRGQLVPQVGAITMDQLMIDVSTVDPVQVGDVVTLIGQEGHHHLTVDQWATALGTISYEIVCGFKPRLPRVPLIGTEGRR